MNGAALPRASTRPRPSSRVNTLDRWARLPRAKPAIDRRHRRTSASNEAANALYQFIWSVSATGTLELTKPILQGDDEAGQGRDPRDHRLGAARRR